MAGASKSDFRAPRGTRDLYPEDAARRRLITEAWRTTSIRHGFDEIDGPTFEHLDLYTVKSGEGIVSELFSFRRAGGETDFALRPEFTPTLARMYGARAGSLGAVRWFSVGPYFRAERPQRGRLREFLQWNVDIIGEPGAGADADVIACCIDLLADLGLTPDDVQVHVNHRAAMSAWFAAAGVPAEAMDAVFPLIDKRSKLPADEYRKQWDELGVGAFEQFEEVVASAADRTSGPMYEVDREAPGVGPSFELLDALGEAGLSEWVRFDPSVARGLAYYTGTVFEVIADGERAVCGGGRYDTLVELFGGKPTPAVGFGFGDVVLALLLEDKGLMPREVELSERVGMRPDVFVLTNGEEASEAALRPLLASLRGAGLHARRSFKATRNIGKLLKDASAQHARNALIIESAVEGTLKNLETGEQATVVLDGIADALKREG